MSNLNHHLRYVKLKIAGEAFNISSPRESSLLGMIKELKNIMGVRKAKLTFRPKRAGDVRRTCADLHKSARLLGYRDLVSFREGLEKQPIGS